MSESTRLPNGTPAYDKVLARAIWEGDCLVFKGATAGNGYGVTSVPMTHKMIYAHRAVMEHHHGPSHLDVMHSCDNPPCVNIEHLRYGTRAENMADMASRKRGKKSRFTEMELAAIRSDPRVQTVIAAEYGCSQPLISLIKKHDAS